MKIEKTNTTPSKKNNTFQLVRLAIYNQTVKNASDKN